MILSIVGSILLKCDTLLVQCEAWYKLKVSLMFGVTCGCYQHRKTKPMEIAQITVFNHKYLGNYSQMKEK